ncbi:PREDICTED: SET and MYND domain-containing protein 4-like [Habropoda laboriosa]|uniref:SET and MYND domain-containing protein 4-like n=1 Tax=Habropoda laboriosa TaxID=597456 RepID=UPI00083D4679|nr:PREDICTED: SET and MYND domain-containing protein 4-like [Habropoda laboriosa]
MEEGEGSYRSLCSLETLRSGKRGFFSEFAENAKRVAGEQWISKVFGRLSSDEGRIRTLFTDGKIKEEVLGTLNRTEILYRGKDAAASRARRLEGFEAATAAERQRALLLFSQAVLRAPLPGKCQTVDRGLGLPLAYLARAEIFLASNEHALAMQDLSFLEEMKHLLPDTFRADLARKKEACEKFLRANEKSLVPVVKQPLEPLPPRLTGGEHPRISAASALLEIEETETAGKQAVANGSVAPGDTLVVEPALAANLLPEFFGTHCQHCFSRFRAPVGCPDCSSVAFCGRKCRDAAMTSYHKYECKILALLIGSGMSVLSMLALRMVTQIGPTNCFKIWRALNSQADSVQRESSARSNSPSKLSKSAKRRERKKKLRDSKREGNRIETGESNEDEQVDLRPYDLVMHQKRRTADDFFERSLMAVFLLKCLQRVGFFEQAATTTDDETPSEQEIAVASLLLKHLQLLQFNAHEVFETRTGTAHRFRGSRPVYLGVAIYPTVARFNHDCYPAVTRYFVGRCIVIRATRSLRAGDVLAENYGPIFTKRSLEERRRTLAGRYWFWCECTACRENWPRFETLTNDVVRARCPTEGCSKVYQRPRDPTGSIVCCGCRRKIDLRESFEIVSECERLYERGLAAMEEERPEQALEAFFEGASKFHRVAVPPHKDTHLAEIAASACMADQGTTWRADPLL